MDKRLTRASSEFHAILTGANVPEEVHEAVLAALEATQAATQSVLDARSGALASKKTSGAPWQTPSTPDDLSDVVTYTAGETASVASLGLDIHKPQPRKKVWALGFIDASDAPYNSLTLIDDEELFDWIQNREDTPPPQLYTKIRPENLPDMDFTPASVTHSLTPGTYHHDKAHMVCLTGEEIPINDEFEIWSSLRDYLAAHPELELVDRFDSYHY